MLFYHVHIELRYTRIRMFSKAIGEIVIDRVHSLLIGVDIQVTERIAVRPQVIKASRVVVMLMRQQYAVNLLKRNPKELHADIRTAVDKDTRRLRLQQGSRTETLVADPCSCRPCTDSQLQAHPEVPVPKNVNFILII